MEDAQRNVEGVGVRGYLTRHDSVDRKIVRLVYSERPELREPLLRFRSRSERTSASDVGGADETGLEWRGADHAVEGR